MITLNSTKISLIVALVFSSFSTLSWGQAVDETTKFKNTDIQIRTVCNNNGSGTDCSVFSVGKIGKKKLIVFPFAPSDIKFDTGIFVIVFPCGTECSATYFYSPSKGMGGPFPLIVGYNLKKELALSLSKNPLPVFNIYARRNEKPALTIKLDVGAGQDLAELVKKVEFKDDEIVITYVDQQGSEKAVTRSVGK
jgi:hypothetical protein